MTRLVSRTVLAIAWLASASCAGAGSDLVNFIEPGAVVKAEAETAATPAKDIIHATVTRGELDMIFALLFVKERAEDGVLVLSDGAKQYPIAESWRLWAFEKAGWTDAETTTEVFVIASYATGIGPEGAKPFRAKIIMRNNENGWSPLTPQILPSEDDGVEVWENGDELRPRPLDPVPDFEKQRAKSERAYIRVANTREQHTALAEEMGDGLADVSVDYGNERLVTATRMLTSGSIKIRDVRVHKNAAGYEISYSLNRPRIGTADIKLSAIYIVLPDDGLPLSAFERSGKRGRMPKGKRIDVVTGILNRVR